MNYQTINQGVFIRIFCTVNYDRHKVTQKNSRYQNKAGHIYSIRDNF